MKENLDDWIFDLLEDLELTMKQRKLTVSTEEVVALRKHVVAEIRSIQELHKPKSESNVVLLFPR